MKYTQSAIDITNTGERRKEERKKKNDFFYSFN